MKLRIFILFLFLLSSCAGLAPDQKKAKKKKDPTVELIKKNKELDQKNQELANKLDSLEKKRKEEATEQQRRLESMDKTISLMEQNLAQMQQPPSNQNQAPVQRPVTPIDPPPERSVFSPDPPAVAVAQPLARQQAPTPLIRDINEPIALPQNTPQQGLLQNPQGQAKRVKMVSPNQANIPDEPVRQNRALPPDSPFSLRKEIKEKSFSDPALGRPISPIILGHTPGAKRSYNDAFKAYSKREYDQAIELFTFFLSRFPNDLDADNAQFWIGQAYFELKAYEAADEAFRKVLVNYKHGATAEGHKTPDAIFMLGKIYKSKLRPKRARYYF